MFMTGAPFFSLITSSGADLEIGFFCLVLLYSPLNILYPRSTGTKIFCHLTPFDLHMEWTSKERIAQSILARQSKATISSQISC